MPAPRRGEPQTTPAVAPPSAYIQAYEASLVYPPSGRGSGSGSGRRHVTLIPHPDDEGGRVMLDRYDILHLLPTIPRARSHSHSRDLSASPSPSSSTWSLPSDVEETFYLSGEEEIEEYQRTKRQKWVTELREARIKEREREDQEEERGKEEEQQLGEWPEDENPPEAILALMAHTSHSLSSSPNPQILISRILTHHASDPRFDFLRGRYKSTWEEIRRSGKRASQRSGTGTGPGVAVGSLVGDYASSDEDEEDDPPEPPPPPENDPPPPPSPPEPEPEIAPGPQVLDPDPDVVIDTSADPEAELEKQRQRRLRAEEWKRARAAAKSG